MTTLYERLGGTEGIPPDLKTDSPLGARSCLWVLMIADAFLSGRAFPREEPGGKLAQSSFRHISLVPDDARIR